MIVKVHDHCGDFAENKDDARHIREDILWPAVRADAKQTIVLDFDGVDSSTQSFIHALISDIFQALGEDALRVFEFKNCTKSVRSLIGAVINYSLP